jgi:hypothetical protein
MRFPVIVIATSLLLLACTSNQPTPDPAAKADASKSTPTPAAPTEAAKSATPEPAKPSEWWCVCYQTVADDGGPQPASACRAQEKQCRALEKRIARGGRGIVPGSLTHGCRKLTGEHPGDLAGGRDKWQPSKLEGAWSSEGACLLPGAADVVAAAPTEQPEEDIFAWLDGESIGPLKQGLSADEVVKLLGEAGEKDEITEEGATGDWVQSWKYPDRGVDLWMRADTQTGPQTVAAITILQPCEFATARGIKIGSSYDEVAKAYGDVKDQDRFFDDEGGGEAAPPEEDDKTSFVAGSVFGGLIFELDAEQKVASIFMGAAAE